MESLYKLAVMVSAMDNLTGPIRKMSESFSNFEKLIQSSKGIVDWGNRMAVSGALVQGAADSGIRALTSLMKPVMEVETAMGEMASVGIKDMNALSKAAEAFTFKWSGTTEAQFISSAYDIKGGIETLSDTAVAEYTRIAALTSKATKSATEEMTSLFATGYGIFKGMYSDMSDIKFGEMFSAGLTGAVQQFKSDGRNMSLALTNLGATATSAGIAMEEQFSILGMLQATMPGGESGTKYRAFLQSAARAGKTLDLSFVDANGQLMGTADILDILHGKFGPTLDAMEQLQIKKAFGSDEAVAMINLLYPKVDELRGNIDGLGITMQQGTIYTEGIAKAMNSGLGEQLGILGQNISILKRSVGQELSPLIKAFVPVLQGWVMGFQNLARAHPTIVRTGLLIAAFSIATLAIMAPLITVGAGLVMFAGYITWSFGQIGKGLTFFRGLANSVFTGVVKVIAKSSVLMRPLISGLFNFGRSAIQVVAQALRALIPLIWSTTIALLSNPITWVIVGVVALGGAIYALWRNWDQVKVALGNGWDWLMQKFGQGKQWFAGIFQSIIGLAQQYGPMILAVFLPVVGIPLLIAQHWDTIKTLIPAKITELINNIRGKIAEFRLSGAALIQAFVLGIQSMIAKPAEVVKTGFTKLRRLLPHSDAKEGPLSTLTYSGRALINTFSSGIISRSGYLKAAAATAMAGISLFLPMSPVQAADIFPPVPAAISQAAKINPVLGVMPQLPNITGQGEITIPDIPQLNGQAFITPGITSLPNVPDISSSLGKWDVSAALSKTTPSVNMKEIIKETSREREKESIYTTRDRRPIVLMMPEQSTKGRSLEDILDSALRQFEMRGE